jgi:hypothetical protein
MILQVPVLLVDLVEEVVVVDLLQDLLDLEYQDKVILVVLVEVMDQLIVMVVVEAAQEHLDQTFLQVLQVLELEEMV